MSPEDFNKWRIIPRILLAAGYVFYPIIFWELSDWVMNYDFNSLQNEAVALAVIAYPASVLSALGAVLGSLTKSYFQTGTNGS